MSEKVKIVQAEPVEEVVTEKKRNWKAIAGGVALGALAVTIAAVVASKFSGDKEDNFEDYTWTPMPEASDNNNQ